MDKIIDVPQVRLSDGSVMPQLGFGTWTLKDDVAVNSVKTAIEVGYRLIDTAQMYQNEAAVGGGIAASGVSRDQLYVTTKVSTVNMRNHLVRESIEKSIEDLDCGYLDLLLIHWPVKDEIKQTWQIMEEFVEKGMVKSLGCSNFLPCHIEELMTYAKVRPVLNQIEFQPYMQQNDIAEYCTANGIQVEAWGPYGQGQIKVVDDPLVAEIAKKYDRSPVQIILRWIMQHGMVTIPRSTSRAHIAENLDIFDFVLSDEDMTAMNGLHRGQRSNPCNDPLNFPW